MLRRCHKDKKKTWDTSGLTDNPNLTWVRVFSHPSLVAMPLIDEEGRKKGKQMMCLEGRFREIETDVTGNGADIYRLWL